MIAVAILNKQRPVTYVYDIISSCLEQTIVPEKILIHTDNVKQIEDYINASFVTTNPEIEFIVNKIQTKNVSTAKNSILKEALRAGVSQIFLLEDDIEIYKEDTLEKYLATLNELDLGMIFSGFTNTANYVLTAPSPRIKFDTTGLSKGFNAVVTNRHEVGDFVLIDLDKNKLTFSEELDYFEFSEYVFQCWKYNYIPGLNQFFDIENSWEYVGPRKDCKSLRENNIKAIKDDQKKMSDIIKNEWVIENDIKKILDYIIFKLENHNED
jgi:hypothetical protein